jgi:ribosomal protein L28
MKFSYRYVVDTLLGMFQIRDIKKKSYILCHTVPLFFTPYLHALRKSKSRWEDNCASKWFISKSNFCFYMTILRTSTLKYIVYI